jgi:hypothetical protein
MRPATGDAFRNITVNNNTISADSVTDTLTLVAGTNVTLTADVETDSITIAAGAASTGDFTFTNSTASVPVNATLTLTALNNTTKESKLTLSPTTTSSLYAANNLQLGIGYGTGSELYWTFDAVGTLTAPGRIVTPEVEGANDELNIYSNWATDTGISIYSGTGIKSVTLTSDDIAAVVTNVGPTQKQWIFGADGTTQFPNYKFPSEDGSFNQVLSTSGTGSLSWSTPYTSTYIGTTAISFNRSSAAQTLTGITSIDGSAGSVAAANITGTTLASGVTGSSLTSVGTLTSLTTNGTLTRTGNISSSAWGLAGIGLKIGGGVFTDTSTSGTIAVVNCNVISQPTLAFSFTSIATQANTLYIQGAPSTGSNATITTAYALNVGAGNTYLGGSLTVNGQVTAPNRTAFRVIGNGGSVSATTTLTSSNWTLDYQQGTALDTSTGIFTAPTAGLYTVHLVMRTYNNANATINQAIIYKTSGVTETVVTMLEFGLNTSMNHAGVSSVVKLAVGDTLKVVVAIGTLSFDGNDNWSVAFIG